MIAYNKTLLENYFIISQAIQLKKAGMIEYAHLNKIKNELEELQTNRNMFVRIGFCLLGSFLASSIIGVISMFL